MGILSPDFLILLNDLLLKHFKTEPLPPLTLVTGFYFTAFTASKELLLVILHCCSEMHLKKDRDAFEHGKQRQETAPYVGAPSLPERKQEAAS